MTDAAPHPDPLPASAGRGRGPRQREGEGQPPATAGSIVLLLPKIVVTALLALAIADMLAGVFFRYVMVAITDFLDLDPVNFFWVEEVGEFSLTWLTMIGAAIGIADRIHFTFHVLTHHLPGHLCGQPSADRRVRWTGGLVRHEARDQ